jgi:hypothetical protein
VTAGPANAGRSRKKCLGVHEAGRLAVDLRRAVDQVGRVELVAAVVALVARASAYLQIGQVPSM